MAFVTACFQVLTVAEAPSAFAQTRVITRQSVRLPPPRRPTAINAIAAALVDAETGDLLYARHARAVRAVGSTVKIMTALVAIDRLAFSDVLTSSGYVAPPIESAIDLGPRERMTVRDLFYAMMLESANDAADTLARRAGRSRGAFIAAMNRRARLLHMSDSRFGNPIGLDTPRTVSSARDLALLGRAAMRDPRLRRIVGRRSAVLRSGDRVRRVKTRNELLGRYRFVDGVKTGHTLRAGFVMVGSAMAGEARVVSSVLGAPTQAARDRATIALLRYGRAHFAVRKIARADRALASLPIELQGSTASAYLERDLSVTVRDGDRVVLTADLPRSLEGPLSAGARIGAATVERNGKVIETAPLVVRTAIAPASATQRLVGALRTVVPIMLALALALMLVTVAGRSVTGRMRRRRGVVVDPAREGIDR